MSKAIVLKNPEGNHTVRIEHSQGVITDVLFPNLAFSETLANEYANFINNKNLTDWSEPETPEVLGGREEAEKLLKEAQENADKIVSEAKKTAEKLIAEATAIKPKREKKQELKSPEPEPLKPVESVVEDEIEEL